MDDASRPANLVVAPQLQRFGANLAGLALAIVIVGAGAFLANTVTAPVATGAAPLATAAANATVQPSAVASVVPVVAPPIAPTPVPTPATPAVTAAAYSDVRGNYVALTVRPGTVFTAPLAGTVQILNYQLINGEIRLNANDPSRPTFPYVTLVGSDRRLTYRVGALSKDVELLLQSNTVVKVGDPMFKVIGTGPSSWNTFYDSKMTAQILTSLAAIPSGRELDPLPLLPLN